MNKRSAIILIGFMLVFAVNLLAENDYESVEIKTTHVSESVYMLEGSGGNIGVSLGEDGVILIDDQFAPLTEKIINAVKNITDKEIEFVINTHWHHDHTGGNENLGKLAHIIAHDNVRKRMVKGQTIEFLDKEIPPAKSEALPKLTYLSEQFIYMNHEELVIRHFAASHTDGDSVVFFKNANVVHMGDLFFNTRFPFVDLSSGGSIQGLLKSLEKIIFELQPGVKIIPGHGPMADLKALKEYFRMIQETVAVVTGAMSRGQELDEIIASDVLADWSEAWGGGFISTEAWIKLIYQSYEQEVPAVLAPQLNT